LGFIVWRSDLVAYDTEAIQDMQPLSYGNYLIPDPVVAYTTSG
jgi:hypothetical protein